MDGGWPRRGRKGATAFQNLKRGRRSEREMERAVPVRKTHASTAGLLSWSESPGPDNAAAAAGAAAPPSSRPSLKVEQIDR